MRNPHADDLIRFLNASPSPWHAVATAVEGLTQAGAIRLREEDEWSLHPGETVFVTRGGSILALRIPANFSVRSPKPFHIIAAHTDSPGLRLKPRAPKSVQEYRQWGVEVYGGALFNSWLDRDLGIAGRVYGPGDGNRSSDPKLVRLEDQPLRIPQVAIHLDRTVNEQGLVLNPQRHLVPVTGQTDSAPAEGPLEARLEKVAGAPFSDLTFDLCLYDTTPAGYGGLGDEFIYSGRLDNLAMSYATLAAFIAAAPEGAASEVIQVIALFDHEEIGSVSAEGARSNFLPVALERAATALGLDRNAWLRLLPQSFLISADMAHALHPNYVEKHEPDHFPLPNRGIVLKANANHRYMGDAPAASRLLDWARRAGVPVQNFVSRSDLACGSTVGPALGADLGMPGVDVGNPMLSMHSAREMCGADDPAFAIALFQQFLRG
jgi:aspartyl aminopeptidase